MVLLPRRWSTMHPGFSLSEQAQLTEGFGPRQSWEIFDGESVFQPRNFSSQKIWPLVYCKECSSESLARFNVRNKIVLCDGDFITWSSPSVKNAGGAAMIMAHSEDAGFSHESYLVDLPSTAVSFWAGQDIKTYINSTSSPRATILFEGTQLGDPFSPTVTYYSSRGPSTKVPGVLKPDIIGPGKNILAGWSPLDPRHLGTTFQIVSGTSMSCPHLSGVAALLKSAHPDWSVAALKSAIMTTADLINAHGVPILDEKFNPANIYTAGAGHVNLNRALDPGLVYDIAMDEYIPFLCGLGYTEDQVKMITQEPADCSSRIPQGQLNYPTLSAFLGSSQTFSRTVTNMGEPVSCYSVRIVEPLGVNVVVRPSRMCFTRLKQKATYYVTFRRSKKMTYWGNNMRSTRRYSLSVFIIDTIVRSHAPNPKTIITTSLGAPEQPSALLHEAPLHHHDIVGGTRAALSTSPRSPARCRRADQPQKNSNRVFNRQHQFQQAQPHFSTYLKKYFDNTYLTGRLAVPFT
ncbi:Subtilase family protein [Striga hermonthica]|uniref:Subtilase family protein n=1 Tax=Striga hermonthica TaxID=68872 RepID=A0A9N7MMY2_STRHE|nr:Subtilase family protein [Striga hermonthica]